MSGPGADQSRGNPHWNQNPYQFDKSLVKRQSAMVCGDPAGSREDYDLPLHIGAVFIILFVSASACAFPLVVVKLPRLRIPPNFLFVVRHFGTGVLLATAFVHLLPTAFISLTDPCLPPFWNQDYPAMAGAIALGSVFIIAIIEMVFSPGRNMCATPIHMLQGGYAGNPNEPTEHEEAILEEEEDGEEEERERRTSEPSGPVNPASSTNPPNSPTALLYGRTNYGRSNSTGQQLARINAASAQQDQISRVESQPHATPEKLPEKTEDVEVAHVHAPLTVEQKQKKALLQCLLLEIGILFHSIFIGMALSVALGNDFIVLLIAITFHQTFEGLALGSRIASMTWKPGAWQPWAMALAYGCTTPVGQAIGLATHTLYAPDSMTGLLMVGIMNAISSGLLTFTSLIDLMSEDFLSDESWRILRGKKRIVACLLVFMGAFGMSLIGAWA